MKLRRRARQRGITHVPTILEATMVMGWFVMMIIGEKTVSSANDARRSAEDQAQQQASGSSGSDCQGGGEGATKPGLPSAQGSPSVFPNGQAQGQQGMAMALALGVPQVKTFGYYTMPLNNVRVKLTATANGDNPNDRATGKQFEGQRQLGCTEKPLDTPKGSLDMIRMPLWVKNLQGY